MTVILKLFKPILSQKTQHVWIQTTMKDKPCFSSYESDLFMQLQLRNCGQQLRETFYLNTMQEFEISP